MSWPTVKLSELCEINIGKTPARANNSYWGEGYPWLSIADMSQGRNLFFTKEEITSLAVNETKIKLVKKGTVLFSFKLSIGKLGIATRDLFTNEAIAALPIKDKSRLCEEYLIYAMSQIDAVGKTDRAVMGATLNKKKLAELEIPLPPLAEQKRIAVILDKADAIRQKRKQAIDLADEFLRSVFLDMFGDPVTNPKRWEVKPLKSFAKITTGNTPPRKEPENYGTDIEWIKSDNINTPNHFLTTSTEGLSSKGAEKGRVVSSGSVLMTCIAGSLSCIGNIAIADRNVAFNQQINAIQPTISANTDYLYGLMLVSKKKLQDNSTNSMKGMISKGTLEGIEFPCPPMEKQAEFSSFFKSYLAQLEKLKSSEHKAKELLSSASQKAFAGEL
ncbi:restriction endonuclease subunit S [Vibrio sp. 10N.286.52.E2]|uniref:restriction endonuclease subunit S n=1 Tax=unclassified Vibrio TaxID=2614977 RepID=UPI0014837044|nr:restriction endonuclease subunit S [Vibrio sp. F13]